MVYKIKDAEKIIADNQEDLKKFIFTRVHGGKQFKFIDFLKVPFSETECEIICRLHWEDNKRNQLGEHWHKLMDERIYEKL